ncbi:MAG: DUF1345 domain-containing protein [Massilia sp.]
MTPTSAFAKHPKFARIVLARPFLFGGIGVGILTALAVPSSVITHQLTRGIIGWNTGALVYLLTTLTMMFRSSSERMRERAVQHDDGRMLILMMVIVAAVCTLAAIIGELGLAKELHGAERTGHVALCAATLFSAWAFTQVTMAAHYAHDFYAAAEHGNEGGLDFPGEDKPDYADFLYFSCIIGTSGQTADVAFTSRTMRRTGLLHCVLAFFFNATLLALTINIASGMI